MNSLLVAVALLAGGHGTSLPPGCALKDQRVESFIKTEAFRVRGHEYCEFRLYASGDVDGDGKEDFIVLFGIEGAGGGGNHVEFYLACFSSKRRFDPILMRIGERGKRVYDSVVVQEGRVIIQFKTWRTSDAMCCPSGRATSAFSLEPTGLVEQQEATDAR